MATEVLYEIVCVNQRFDQRRCTRAKALRRTFETTAGVKGTKGGRKKQRYRAQVDEGVAGGTPSYVEWGYGRWVKQLSFHMDFVSVEDVAAIVHHCPNLRTLIIDKRNAWKQAHVNSLLLNAIPAELQRVELLRTWGNDSRVIPQEFATILGQCSSIKAASLSCENIHFGDDILPPSQLTALTLINHRTAHLIFLERWELPSLTHLGLTKTVVTPVLISVVQHFGPQLLFLDIKPEAMSIITRKIFLQLCSSISNSCRRLRGFVLYDKDILPHSLCSRSLTHLVLTTHCDWYSLHTGVEKILVSEFPALTCIRVLAGWGPLPPLDSSTHWALECRARGIRVEDEDGMDLLIPITQSKFVMKNMDFIKPT
jgi:hypothetical protein